MSKKRKPDTKPDAEHNKRIKMSSVAGPSYAVKLTVTESIADQNNSAPSAPRLAGSPDERKVNAKGKRKDNSTEMDNSTRPITKEPEPKRRMNKLQPPRPFPTVPTSVSATGPRSAHKEGKNFICITRKTPLGAYMRRCKDVFVKDGYKILHLSAMGAAIPHLLQLSVALPKILPFPPEDIHTQVLTGTVEVRDEIIPDDEEEDITYQTRGKSTLSVAIKIGDGEFEGDGESNRTEGERKDSSSNQNWGRKSNHSRKGKEVQGQPRQIVFQEPEQDEIEP